MYLVVGLRFKFRSPRNKSQDIEYYVMLMPNTMNTGQTRM